MVGYKINRHDFRPASSMPNNLTDEFLFSGNSYFRAGPGENHTAPGPGPTGPCLTANCIALGVPMLCARFPTSAARQHATDPGLAAGVGGGGGTTARVVTRTISRRVVKENLQLSRGVPRPRELGLIVLQAL